MAWQAINPTTGEAFATYQELSAEALQGIHRPHASSLSPVACDQLPPHPARRGCGLISPTRRGRLGAGGGGM